jgi:hypothetical protein
MRSFELKKFLTAFLQALASTALHLLEQALHELELFHSELQFGYLAFREFMPPFRWTRPRAKPEK